MEKEGRDGEVTYLGNQDPAVAEAVNQLSGEGLEEEEAIFNQMLLRRPTTNYRGTTIGRTLTASLDELLEKKKISLELYNKAMCQFDRTILSSLSQKLTSRVAFKASKLKSYKYVDGMWHFDLEDTEFREYNSFANVHQVKMVAFNGKVPDPSKMPGGKSCWGNSAGDAGGCFSGGSK